MTDTLWGIDSSYDTLTADEAVRLKAAGVGVFMQCLWTGLEQPAPRVVSLRNAMNAGMIVGGYISSTPKWAGSEHVNSARLGIPDDIWAALVRVPIDLEIEGIDIPKHVYGALNQIAQLGKPRDIYTSFGFWSGLGNPPHPPDTGLWDASWGKDPAAGFLPRSYGGWTPETTWGLQFTGGQNIEGQFADRDIFRASAFLPAVPPAPAPTETLAHTIKVYSTGRVEVV